ncbi:T9SS type A sorting domain-containing protein, partial [bacterium]|nr:T9SS type A sorting domain-containing protein [bacterium]
LWGTGISATPALAVNNSLNGTQTHKTVTGSVSINAGTDTGAPTTDQRGAERNGTTDIGAYEWWDDGGSLMATDYAVSGAGTTAANGTYVSDIVVNGKTSYKYVGATTYYLFYYNSYWIINTSTSVFMPEFSNYYVSSTAETPPSSGWAVGMDGDSPAPTVAEAVARLTYSPDTFQESSANDGTIGNTLTITYDTPGADYFTGSNGTFASSKYSASNVPAGLTMVITKNSDLELSVALTGTATSSDNANDISDLEIAFNDDAFNDGNAFAVSNSTKSDINVNFIQPYSVASSGGDFTTIAAAISGAGNGDILNIAAETFTEVLLTVNKDLSFLGQGAGSTIVQAHASYNSATHRVFQIESGKTVVIENLTVRYGKITSGQGAGINNQGTLTLTGCGISDNVCSSGGGGINSDEGSLTMTNCTINGNSGTYGGGMRLVLGTFTLTNCTISGNTATWSFNAGGGGIYHQASGVLLTLVNCTIAGNTTAYYGGGIQAQSGTSITIKNTIIANNSASLGGADIYWSGSNTLTDNGYNIVETSVGDSKVFNATGDITGDQSDLWGTGISATPALAVNNSLNGTQTHKTVTGSVSINAGTDTGAPTTDQRGAERNGTTDIGAYEWWDDDASLPVELSSFTAENQSGGVLLKWSTESEIENLGFILERRDSKFEIGNWEEIAGYITDSRLQGQGSVTHRTEYSYTDNAVTPGVTYEYRLGDVDYNGKVTWHKKLEVKVESESTKIPSEFGLHKAYPNPFNPAVTLSYGLKEAGQITLQIYNLRGQLVETLISAYQLTGTYDVTWQPENVSAGVYIIRLQSGSKTNLRKLVFVK